MASELNPDGFMARMKARNERLTTNGAPTPVANGAHTNGDHTAYTNAAATAELTSLADASAGQRNHTLNVVALKLGRLPLERDTLRQDLLNACHTNGLITDDGLNTVEATIRSAFNKADHDGPRIIPAQQFGKPQQQQQFTNGHHPPPTESREIRWTRGDQIDTAIPIWAWAHNDHGRIQIGTLALFAGRPGAGKSTAARWLAAQTTRGNLEGCWHNQPQHVAYIAAEESAKYTIGPGLLAAGADMSRIHFPAVYHGGQTAQLLSIIDETALTQYLTNTGITIVIVDPLMSTITANADINKNNEVRAQVQPWTRIAEAIDGIVIGVAHLRKSGTGDVVAAVTGSSAFGELARAIFGFAKNAEDDTRVMSQHKNSTGYEDLSLAYRIESQTVKVATGETTEVGKFTIIGDSEVTVEDILSDPGMSGAATNLLECQRWLEDYLTQQGTAPSREVKAEAHKELGSSSSTVDRSAKRLKVKIDSRGFPRRTYWTLPRPVASDDFTQSRHSGPQS